MTLEQAIATLEIAHGQQMSDTVEEAIRTVLDGMKQRVEVVRCKDCNRRIIYKCPMRYAMLDDKNNFCSFGQQIEKENKDA